MKITVRVAPDRWGRPSVLIQVNDQWWLALPPSTARRLAAEIYVVAADVEEYAAAAQIGGRPHGS